MKKGVLILLALSFILLPMMSAEACSLDVALINQDPYPAIQEIMLKQFSK